MLKKESKKLSEARAWRAIAEKLLTQQHIVYGICKEIQRLREKGVISWNMQDRMVDRCAEHVAAYYWTLSHATRGYVYGDAETGKPIAPGCSIVVGYGHMHEERAMGCLWMALEAESGE